MSETIFIIPDIHGRPFWREAVKDINDVPAVFLGDYLDPYLKSRITPAKAIDNFQEILALKKTYPGKVTLLLGDHDLHYFLTIIGGRGIDHERFGIICKLFIDNLELFDLALELDDSGNQYLFSHAGVLRGWLDRNDGLEVLDIDAPISIGERMNWMFHDKAKMWSILIALAQTGYAWHEWWRPWGSPIWALMTDHNPRKAEIDGVYQIFGHTRQKREVITPYWACLDCGAVFVLEPSTRTIKRKRG